jgi:hypothetical protein
VYDYFLVDVANARTQSVALNNYKTKQITSMSVRVVMTYHGTDPAMVAIASSFAQVGRRASVLVGSMYCDGTW